MATTTVLRPSATSSGLGWTPSTGTLHGVTSDDSDATYATWGGSGSALILATPADSPPAGERRHAVRLRARGEDGDAWWAVRLSSGVLTAAAAAQFTTSPSTVSGSWGFGAPPDGSTVLYTYVTGQSTGVKINELYIDMDSREAPTFTPQVLDGSGTATTTVSDTTQPTVRADAIDLDDLNARQYRYWITLSGSTVFDTGVVSGASVNVQTTPLDNGSYVLHAQIWTTLGADTAYASDEETLAFTVLVDVVQAPGNPTVVPLDGTPFYTLGACAPYVGDFDDAVGYVEIQRVDCPVGGYLALTGSGDSYASTPDPGLTVAVNRVSGQFEGSVTGWAATGGSVAYSTAQAHGGTGSALMTVVGAPGQTYIRPDGVGNSALVTPGRTYRATFWLYAPVAITTVTAAIDWFDAGVGYLSGEYDTTPIGAGAWTFYEVDGVAPVGAVYGNYGPTIADVNGTQVYVDQVTFDDITPPVDLEVVIKVGRDDDWFPSQEETLVSHYLTTGDQRAWRLSLSQTGYLEFAWSEDGTSALEVATATAKVPVDPFGNAWVRLRFLADSGGAALTEFATRETEEADWTPVGDPIVGSGPRPLFASTADYIVGAYMDATPLNLWTGRIYSAEIRSAPDGTLMMSPDFTAHLNGTTTFSDDQGNVWTVYSPATIYSPTSTVTVAMLGPLETDECAEWVDFTLPRTGSSSVCDHAPEPCCSYYRARTVGRMDGDLRISDWSDSFDPGIPVGMIVMWPSTAASIPAGWSRTTALDSKYPKGVATSATQPGTTGGADTHVHTVPTHTHDTAHTHTTTGASGTAVGTQVASDGAVGTTAILSSHTHTVPTTGAASVTASGTGTPGIGTDANDPARLNVIFIQSDGTPLGVPANALALMPDIAPSGWTDYANATGRFLKGAAAAGDGGATTASTLDAHVHSVALHTHTGPTHTHSSTSGSVTSDKSLFAGAVSVLWTSSHTHSITAASTTAASLGSGGAGSSGASSGSGALDPPFRNVRARQNTSGIPDLPIGVMCAWRGSLGSIPSSWQLCDGTNGTLDMSAVYPKGATASIGTTGGSLAAHSHTSSSHSDHTTSGHVHTQSLGSAGAATALVSSTATVTVATGTHTHTSPSANSTTPTVGSSTSGTLANATNEPAYEEVAFVQLMETPTPPPVPDLFCLEWDDEQHLIRTLGPDGPLWANVGGKFEWDVVRPFTAANGVMGTRFVTSAAPGGRNLHMTAAVESEDELATLHAVLSRPLVLISPSDAEELWAAPVAESVKVVKIGRLREVTADFIGTGPQPAPQLADVGT